MKKTYLIFTIVVSTLIILFSCSNDNDNYTKPENDNSKELRTKLIEQSLSELEVKDIIENKKLGDLQLDEKSEFITNLFKAYGWEDDEEVSDTDWKDMVEQADVYEVIRVVWAIKELTHTKLVPVEEDAVNISPRVTGTTRIQGQHSSSVASSVTEMNIRYDTNGDDISVLSSRIVKSNPNLPWTQESSGTTSFSNHKATAWASGYTKYLKRKFYMKMTGYLTRYSSSRLPSGGKIEHFNLL